MTPGGTNLVILKKATAKWSEPLGESSGTQVAALKETKSQPSEVTLGNLHHPLRVELGTPKCFGVHIRVPPVIYQAHLLLWFLEGVELFRKKCHIRLVALLVSHVSLPTAHSPIAALPQLSPLARRRKGELCL